jgi:hypothetical protein
MHFKKKSLSSLYGSWLRNKLKSFELHGKNNSSQFKKKYNWLWSLCPICINAFIILAYVNIFIINYQIIFSFFENLLNYIHSVMKILFIILMCVSVQFIHLIIFLFMIESKALFGWEKKVEGKKVRGKIVEGMKVRRKWMESRMFI